jgi:hypothetical protein
VTIATATTTTVSAISSSPMTIGSLSPGASRWQQQLLHMQTGATTCLMLAEHHEIH